MIAWPAPDVPTLPGTGRAPRVHDDATGALCTLNPSGPARVYVCGITPYDATHLGHAATYVTFDVLLRVLADAGHEVVYAQNVTDVDDPLLERAARDGIPWEDLATAEIQLFRDDMTALRVLPPQHYTGVVESIPQIGAAVAGLVERGSAYGVAVPAAEGSGEDLYLDLSTQPGFGSTSGWSREQMLEVFADRGGDPDRAGKRDPLDPLLWRAARTGEPSWEVAGLPPGRPGWHIECTAIAHEHLGSGFDVQGGGTDLVFPHHEMSAVQATALHGDGAFARAYLHQAMVGLHGEKMSKSKGNLVLVSRLRADGVNPAAIRLALLAHHYRSPWEWTDDVLEQAQERLATWRQAADVAGDADVDELLADLRERLADDLDTPGALTRVDAWAHAATTKSAGPSPTATAALDALLGVAL